MGIRNLDIPEAIVPRGIISQALKLIAEYVDYDEGNDDWWINIGDDWDLNVFPTDAYCLNANLHRVIHGATETSQWISLLKYCPEWSR